MKTSLKLGILTPLLLLIVMCGNSPQTKPMKHTSKYSFSGHWINKLWADSLSKYKTAKFIKTYNCLELYISDSLPVAWSFEGEADPLIAHWTYNFPYIQLNYKTRRDSVVTLENKGDYMIVRNNEQTLFFVRTDSQNYETQSSTGYITASRKYANETLLGGTYEVVENRTGKAIKNHIIFSRDGTITNMKPYNFFDICLAGNCRRFCDEMDLVYFSPIKNEPGGKYYAFRWLNNYLELYEVKSLEWMSNWPDIQPERLWLRLRKVK